MPECARCGAFTDDPPEKDYHYCDACQDHFAEIEDRGIVVEQETNGEVYVIVTALDEQVEGGTEYSQVEGLARGKYLSDKSGLPALFKYNESGSRWDLDDYLKAHPSIRMDVTQRLQRVPEDTDRGLIQRIRDVLT